MAERRQNRNFNFRAARKNVVHRRRCWHFGVKEYESLT
jgi:hypothetical protein